MRHFRLIVAEAERSPEIGRIFYEAGPKRGQTCCRADRRVGPAGLAERHRSEIAAHQFLGCSRTAISRRGSANYLPELTAAQIEAEAAAAGRHLPARLRAARP